MRFMPGKNTMARVFLSIVGKINKYIIRQYLSDNKLL